MNNNFNWAKALGFGVLIWLIMFILGAILVGLNVALTVWPMLILAIIAALVAYGFSVNADPQTAGQAFGYGVVFVVIGLILDYLISRQLQPGIFGLWTYWLGYVFVLFAPLTAIGSSTSQTTTTHYQT